MRFCKNEVAPTELTFFLAESAVNVCYQSAGCGALQDQILSCWRHNLNYARFSKKRILRDPRKKGRSRLHRILSISLKLGLPV